MSKILIDEEVLETFFDNVVTAKVLCVNRRDYDRLDRIATLIRNEIEETKQKHFSVLEWHPVSEKPKIGSQIIVRLTFGRGVDVNFVMSKCDLHGNILEGYTLSEYDLSSVIEWTYLPE
jgi:hypothetical protein